MNRGAWWAALHRVPKSQTQLKQLSTAQSPSKWFSVQSLSVQLFVTPWTAAHQASLSITNSQSLLKIMSIKLVMPSNHLILCRPLLLPLSIFPSIMVFSKQWILKEINPDTHWKTDVKAEAPNTLVIWLIGKTLMVGKTEGKRRGRESNG